MKKLSKNEIEKVTQLVKLAIVNLNHDIEYRQSEIVASVREEYRQTKRELEVILKKIEAES